MKSSTCGLTLDFKLEDSSSGAGIQFFNYICIPLEKILNTAINDTKCIINGSFSDCGPMTADHLQLTCYDGTLTLSWRTNTTYGGEISEIPEDLKSTLNEKIEDKGRAFTLFLFDNTPK